MSSGEQAPGLIPLCAVWALLAPCSNPIQVPDESSGTLHEVPLKWERHARRTRHFRQKNYLSKLPVVLDARKCPRCEAAYITSL